MTRQRLPERRYCETFQQTINDTPLTISKGYDDYGRVKEVFINVTGKSKESHLEVSLRDAAMLVSHSLQRGATPAELAHSAVRNPDGSAASHIGVVLDDMVKS